MTPFSFVEALSAFQLESVFNPYRDRCPVHDRPDAPERRKVNLCAFLEVVLERGVDSIWIARDLGYRGGRRTGLPLTDEIHLQTFSEVYGVSPLRATEGPPMAERTAAVVWQVLSEINRPVFLWNTPPPQVNNRPVFLWNIFPLHPHEPGKPHSNRCHTRAERDMFRDLLLELLEMLQPRRWVGIGRDAQNALADLGLSCHAARHPSYGGQAEFIQTMHELHDFKPQIGLQRHLQLFEDA